MAFWQFRIWYLGGSARRHSELERSGYCTAELNRNLLKDRFGDRSGDRSGGTFLVTRAILGAARDCMEGHSRSVFCNSSSFSFKALVVHLYWHLYTVTAGLGQDLWASKFGLAWLRSLFFFVSSHFIFGRRILSIIGIWHRHLASAFRIHLRHTPLVTLLSPSYSIKLPARTTLVAFPSQRCLTSYWPLARPQ